METIKFNGKNIAKNKNEVFRSMFVVDPQPTSVKKGNAVTGHNNIPKHHIFNISNFQTIENGTIIKDAPERQYFKEVAYTLLNNLKTSQIHPFLNYHYNHATNKTGFVDFIKYDIWDSMYPEREVNEKKENIIEQWKPQIETEQPTPKEQHTDIFVNGGYKLFDYIWNTYIKDEKGPTEQVSYYYRKMSECKPKYIHANHEDFRTWLKNNSGYDFSISTIKTLRNTKNTERDRNYSNSLEYYNLET